MGSRVSTIRVQTKYDPDSKTAGALQGDSTARSLLTQIRDLVGANSGASSVFGRLTDIGMDIKVDGTISVNSTKLTSAMGNLTELKKFFSNSDVNNSGNNGMSQRIAGMTKQVLDPDGAISSRTASIKSLIDDNKDKIERIDLRVASVESRLRAQYSALDSTMTQLNGLSSYVTAQLASLNNNK